MAIRLTSNQKLCIKVRQIQANFQTEANALHAERLDILRSIQTLSNKLKATEAAAKDAEDKALMFANATIALSSRTLCHVVTEDNHDLQVTHSLRHRVISIETAKTPQEALLP